MSKVGKSLLKGAHEALSYAKGHKAGTKTHHIKVPKVVNVRAIRKKLDMSRATFAEHYGFSKRTLEKWEQGTRQPEGAARAFLTVIDRQPKMVETTLRSYKSVKVVKIR
jgi:putative transcriptional regulator